MKKAKQILNIVFSRNRALQLEALLRSLKEHDPQAEDHLETVVLHRYDPGPHQNSLEELIEEVGGVKHKSAHEKLDSDVSGVKFVAEDPPAPDRPWGWDSEHGPGWIYHSPFANQVIDLIRQNPRFQYVMFMVDDMVVKGPTPWLHVQELLHNNPKVLNVQLRLGTAMTECYPLSRSQKVPELRDFQIWKLWKWWGADGDWGYPLSVDGAVFRKWDIFNLLQGTEFSNPNSLEANIQRHIPHFHDTVCACLEVSRVFNIPANRVQDDYKNRHMDQPVTDSEYFLGMWNRGLRIDLEPLREIQNNDAHFEVDLNFIQKADR